MDRLDAMAMFVATVDEGSLARAARKLGRSAATVTRAVALLEARIGEPLLLRTTRQLKLTATGARQLATYREVLARIADSETAEASLRAVGGTVVLTAPEMFGRLKVMPLLESFLDRHPATAARMLLLNRTVDLVGEGIDLAVRLAPLPDSGMTAVRLGEVRRLVCASPDYLARVRPPRHPSDLTEHDCIGASDDGDRELWTFSLPEKGRSRAYSFHVRTRISLNSAAAAIDTAIRGHGICHPLSYQVDAELVAGRLVPILTDYEAAPVPVHLVFHPHPRPGGAVRMFVDHAVPLLKAELARIARTLP
jgi:DNA-binding transcriptional LysR family regulator